MQLQALPNLFSQEQASRLHGWALKHLDSVTSNRLGVRTVEAYSSAWREAIAESRNPIDDAAGNLICVRFGDDLKSHAETVANPVLRAIVGRALVVGGGGVWKTVEANCDLIPEELPEE